MHRRRTGAGGGGVHAGVLHGDTFFGVLTGAPPAVREQCLIVSKERRYQWSVSVASHAFVMHFAFV